MNAVTLAWSLGVVSHFSAWMGCRCQKEEITGNGVRTLMEAIWAPKERVKGGDLHPPFRAPQSLLERDHECRY